jgi:hypothetical protein
VPFSGVTPWFRASFAEGAQTSRFPLISSSVGDENRTTFKNVMVLINLNNGQSTK